MNKPNNYDNTQASGEYTPVELGGHYLIIKQVTETTSKKGAPMIVVLFDFDQTDKQPGMFMKSFKDDIRPDKKWPNQATKYILVNDSQTGETSRSFKTFCTCVERSNAGFTVQWAENWGAQFKDKKIGGVFGEEMDFFNNKVSRKRVLRWFISLDKVEDADIPNMSETKAYKDYLEGGGSPAGESASAPASTGTGKGDDFMNIPDTDMNELPFA